MLGISRVSDEVATITATDSIEALRGATHIVARALVANAVREAIEDDGRSLREICRKTGLDPAFVSKIANGKKGASVASIVLIALALGKSVTLSIDIEG